MQAAQECRLSRFQMCHQAAAAYYPLRVNTPLCTSVCAVNYFHSRLTLYLVVQTKSLSADDALGRARIYFMRRVVTCCSAGKELQLVGEKCPLGYSYLRQCCTLHMKREYFLKVDCLIDS